ncbi:MAG: hypothetical protein ACXW4B_10170 [Micavibrio sp.]
MKMTFREVMDSLGVPHELTPYETCPFNVYDAEKGLTCSAEVRMGADAGEVEAEMQLMFDTPPEGGASMQQIIWFKIMPQTSAGNDWTTREARLKNETLDKDMYNWEEKCCNFFGAVVRFLKLDQVPDIDELIEEEFNSRERFHDQYGGGGGKSPKIKPGQLLNIKKGGGF